VWRSTLIHFVLLSDKSKKRKALEPTVPKGSAPKKQATGSVTASTSKAASASAPSSSTSAAAVKKKVVVAAAAAPAMKDAKSDSSFFSAPKAKPKLPTFNKSKPESETSVAQPSTINPFQEALAGLTARKASPATAVKAANTPPPASNTPPATSRISAKTGKPKKVVTWRPKGELEAIKLIQPAVYDDDHDVSAIVLANHHIH
jgi:protein phosphatase 1 regulatory subunit 10